MSFLKIFESKLIPCKTSFIWIRWNPGYPGPGEMVTLSDTILRWEGGRQTQPWLFWCTLASDDRPRCLSCSEGVSLEVLCFGDLDKPWQPWQKGKDMKRINLARSDNTDVNFSQFMICNYLIFITFHYIFSAQSEFYKYSLQVIIKWSINNFCIFFSHDSNLTTSNISQ